MGNFLAEQVRRADYDRYLTALAAPVSARMDLFALYAFNAEIARIREQVSENLIGRMKLQWWRDVIAAIYGGGEPPQGNPVVTGLSALVARVQPPRVDFDVLIDTLERDMTDEGPRDIADLETYADGTSARLTALALRTLGVADTASHEAGRHVGIAWALTGLSRAVLFHARANRILLPEDLMTASGLTLQNVHERANAARLSGVIARVADIARAHIGKGRDLREAVDRRAMPALLLATLAESYLRGLAKHRYDVFDPRHGLQRPAIGRLIWNAARGKY